MQNHVAIIPLRKGSKGIPGKNKKKLLGRPLYSWVLTEALNSHLTKVYLYTDDEEISSFAEREFAGNAKLGLMGREKEDCSDTASTETAMQIFCKKINHDYDTLTLLQATSPLTTVADINNALVKVVSGSCDSVLSLVREKRFIWSKKGESLNYDYNKRPRRQDFDGLLIENGAVYTTTRKQFEASGIRIGGKIVPIIMPSDTFVEIDEPDDFVIIEELLKKRLRTYKGTPGKIKALVLDVDGVFTEGTVYFGKEGEVLKKFNMRDGMGLEILREFGVTPIIMTSENSALVKARMDKLQIEHVYLGVKDKFSRLTEVISQLGLQRSELAYLGDDRNDLANILSCGWGICPNDAVQEVLNSADLRLNNNGGDTAIREAVQFIINYNKRAE